MPQRYNIKYRTVNPNKIDVNPGGPKTLKSASLPITALHLDLLKEACAIALAIANFLLLDISAKVWIHLYLVLVAQVQ